MILEYGDMWSEYSESDLFLITTNATLSDGELVMGNGIARQARNRFPGLAKRLGTFLGSQGYVGREYGCLISPNWPEAKLGLFQTKVNYRHSSPLHLIARSVQSLVAAIPAMTQALGRVPRIDMPFPGIGNGALPERAVLPHIKELPDCVHVWKYSTVRLSFFPPCYEERSS